MAKISCPICDGTNTARILWGMPVWSQKLEKDMNEKRIYIGGCNIMIPPPGRHCFDCDEHVCYDPSPIDIIETMGFSFEIGGFFGGYQKLLVERRHTKCYAKYYDAYSIDEPAVTIQLTEQEYEKYIERIYKSYIKEWKESYVDEGVCDGTQWTIKLMHEGGWIQEWYGSNKYPGLWKRFLKAANSLDVPDIL